MNDNYCFQHRLPSKKESKNDDLVLERDVSEQNTFPKLLNENETNNKRKSENATEETKQSQKFDNIGQIVSPASQNEVQFDEKKTVDEKRICVYTDENGIRCGLIVPINKNLCSKNYIID